MIGTALSYFVISWSYALTALLELTVSLWLECQQQDCVQGGLEVGYLPGATHHYYLLDLRSVGRRAATSVAFGFLENCLETHSIYFPIRFFLTKSSKNHASPLELLFERGSVRFDLITFTDKTSSTSIYNDNTRRSQTREIQKRGQVATRVS